MTADGSVDASDQTAVSEGEAAPVRSLLVDPRLVSILLLSGVGLLASQAVAPALGTIQSGLVVSDAQIGLVLTAVFVPSIVLIPVVGAICDIYGRRLVAMASLAGFGGAGVAIFFAPSFEVMLALRLVQGVCFAPLTPLSVAFIGDVFRSRTATTAQGIRASTNGFVAIAVPAAAGILADVAWNFPFLLYASAFPALVIVYRYFPESDALETDSDLSIRAEFQSWARNVSGAVRQRDIVVLILAGTILFTVRSAVFTLAPLLGTRSIGLSASIVGLLFSLIGAVRVVTSPFAGHFVAWTSRKSVMIVTFAVVVTSLGLFAVADSLSTLVAATATFGFGVALLLPTLNDTVTDSAPIENRSGVVGTLQSMKMVANTASPALAGLLLAATDFRTVFVVAGVLVVVFTVVLTVTLGSSVERGAG